MVKKLSFFLAVAVLSMGCQTLTKSEVTNLTPTFLTRNANNLYQVSAAFDTRQATVVKDSVEGFVMVGTEIFPMQKTPLVPNRWETNIPLPADKTNTFYRIKFNYQYNRIPERRTDSKLSPEYELRIVEKK